MDDYDAVRASFNKALTIGSMASANGRDVKINSDPPAWHLNHKGQLAQKRYNVQRTIGEGASFKVKLGFDTRTNEKVAIKIIKDINQL